MSEEKLHAKYSCSGFSRIEACLGSPHLEEHIPDKETAESSEGTLVHTINEKRLLGKTDYPAHTPEMWDRSTQFVNLVNSLRYETTKMCVEERVRVSDDIWGTADVLLFDRSAKTIHVLDYKDGNVRVSAKGNWQGRLYSIGALKKTEFWSNWMPIMDDEITVTFHVMQPRINNYDYVDYSVEELRALGKEAAHIVATSKVSHGVYKAGEHCQFCKANRPWNVDGQTRCCPALVNKSKELMNIQKGGPQLPAYEEMSHEVVASILEFKPQVSKWLKGLEEYALEHAEGNPYLEVGTKRGKRVWLDEDALVASLESEGLDPYNRTLKGVTEIQRLKGKVFVDAHTEKVSGSPVARVKGTPGAVEFNNLEEDTL